MWELSVCVGGGGLSAGSALRFSQSGFVRTVAWQQCILCVCMSPDGAHGVPDAFAHYETGYMWGTSMKRNAVQAAL